MSRYVLNSDPYGVHKKNFRNTLVSDYTDFLNDKLFLEFGVMEGNSMLDFYNSYKAQGELYNFFQLYIF